MSTPLSLAPCLASPVSRLLSPVSRRLPPIPLAAYLELLRTAHAAALRGDQVGLEQVAPAIIAVNRVTLPEGAITPVDNRWLAQALDTPRPDLAQIAARLGALIDALSYSSDPPAADAEQRLRDMLARPPFTRPEPLREPSWLERFLEWLDSLFGQVFTPVSRSAAQAGSGSSWLIAGVGLLLIGLVLAAWLRGLRRALAPPARLRPADPEAALSADEATRYADDLARTGDYRRAARMLYLATLLWLDEQGRLRYDRSLTNREYLDRLGDNPALCERLRPVVETFDRVWYGDLPLDAPGFATYLGQVKALRE